MKKAACLLLCMMLSCGAASTEVPAAQTTNAVTVYQGTHSDSSDAKMFSLLHFSSVSINKGCSKRLPKAIWMTVLASGEISHLLSGENDQSQSDRNNQCISFSFL